MKQINFYFQIYEINLSVPSFSLMFVDDLEFSINFVDGTNPERRNYMKGLDSGAIKVDNVTV